MDTPGTLIGYGVVAIIFSAFVFAYFIVSLIMLLCCIAKGEDGCCLRFFRIIFPCVLTCLLTAMFFISLSITSSSGPQVATLERFLKTGDCLPEKYRWSANSETLQNMTWEQLKILILTIVSIIIQVTLLIFAFIDVKSSRNRDTL